MLNCLSRSRFEGTKEELLALINDISLAFYCLQSAHRREPERDECMKDYLTLSMDRLYYGEDEVKAFFSDPAEVAGSNGESFFIYPDQEAGSF